VGEGTGPTWVQGQLAPSNFNSNSFNFSRFDQNGQKYGTLIHRTLAEYLARFTRKLASANTALPIKFLLSD